MATTTIIPLHITKGRSAAAVLSDTADYMKNPAKTNGEEFVTAYECDSLTAAQEFMFSKSQYDYFKSRDLGNRDVIAYHLRQSFKPGEIDAATANKIGYDMAMSLTKGKFAFLVCTHVDKAHIHNHILLNAVDLNCSRKFRNFKNSAFALRKISDLLCLQNGLSVIAEPKNSRGSYADWLGKKPPTERQKLCALIDEKLIVGQDFGTFLAALKNAGCEIKLGKHTAVKLPGGKKNIRFDSCGDDYTDAAIDERLRGVRDVAPRVKVDEDAERKATEYEEALKKQNAPSLLIDIQAKIREDKGAGYEQWAKIFNLKQAAKTLLWLQENRIDTYDDLKARASSVSGEVRRLNAEIREIEIKQKDIAELQKYIGTFVKTRKVYEAYRKSGWDRSYYDASATDIILHRAAKKYFDAQGLKGKLPPIATLKQEWATFESEKKLLYKDYYAAKPRHKELQTALMNADNLLRGYDAPQQERQVPKKSRDHGAR